MLRLCQDWVNVLEFGYPINRGSLRQFYEIMDKVGDKKIFWPISGSGGAGEL